MKAHKRGERERRERGERERERERKGVKKAAAASRRTQQHPKI